MNLEVYIRKRTQYYLLLLLLILLQPALVEVRDDVLSPRVYRKDALETGPSPLVVAALLQHPALRRECVEVPSHAK